MNQQHVDILSFLLASLLGFLTGPYPAAIFIAFVASFARTAFENSCQESHSQCFYKWMRYFIISTGVAMFMVSVCAYMALDMHLSVMTSAFFTIFSEELLTISKSNVGKVLMYVVKRTTK